MTADETTLVGVLMAIGVIGVVLPIVPGTLLIWGAGLWWTVADGGGPVRWTAFAVITALLVVGTVVKYLLPARSAAAQGAPKSTLLIGLVCGVIGFFVIPVVGLVVGGIAGIYVAELVRLGDRGQALRSTRAALVAVGIGMLVEFAAALLMVGTWVVALLAT